MINSIAYPSLGKVSQSLQSLYLLRKNRIHRFKAKIPIKVEVGPFEIKTVESVEELKEALALRFEVFHKEMRGIEKANGFDVDEFDFDCDHLVIKERRSNKIIGTYRLNCSLFTDNFYTSHEFLIEPLLRKPGVKLELGRACIDKDFRRGILISILWRGIAEYMAASNASLLFGCATVKTEDPRDAALLTRYFEDEKHVVDGLRSRPTLPYTMPLLNYFKSEILSPLNEVQKQQAQDLLPPLCRAYLKIGASIGGDPAWDKEFGCIDFLTILKREDLNKTLWKKFNLS